MGAEWRIIRSSFKEISFKSSHLFLQGDNLEIMTHHLQPFQQRVHLAYVDPPYNTGSDAAAFSYANLVGIEAWVEFMRERLFALKNILSENGVIILTIDDEMMADLKLLCDRIFGRNNFIGSIPIVIKPGGRSNDSFLAVEHEYILLYGKDVSNLVVNLWPESEANLSAYKQSDTNGRYKLRDFMRTGGHSTPESRPNSFYCIKFHKSTHAFQTSVSLRDYMEKNNIQTYSSELLKAFVHEVSESMTEEDYGLVFPVDSEGEFRVWRQTIPSFQNLVNEKMIEVRQIPKRPPSIRIKDYAKDGVLPRSVWTDSRYDASTYGTKLLKDLIGENMFSYPKSLHAVMDALNLFLSKDEDQIVLDMFGGSGTTSHAVIEINRENKRQHQCITLEQLDYIEDVAFTRSDLVRQRPQKKQVGNTLLGWTNPEALIDAYTDFGNELILAKMVDDGPVDEDYEGFSKWLQGH